MDYGGYSAASLYIGSVDCRDIITATVGKGG